MWQQTRDGTADDGNFAFSRDFRAMLDYRPANVLAVKVTYWPGI